MAELFARITAGFFQALSHPTRIEILQLLKERDKMCVCEIVEKLKKDQSNISRHLNALKQIGILEFWSEGVRSLYRVKNKEVYKIIDRVKSVLHKGIKEHQKILAAF